MRINLMEQNYMNPRQQKKQEEEREIYLILKKWVSLALINDKVILI